MLGFPPNVIIVRQKKLFTKILSLRGEKLPDTLQDRFEG